MNKKKRFDWQRFLAIVKKEFIQVKRDPVSLRLPIVFPIVMMLLFGYAVKMEVDNIPSVVLDQSRTVESRAYIDAFKASNYFVVKDYAYSQKEISDLIDGNQVKTALIIPADFAKKLNRNNTADAQLIIDGTDPTTARTALNSGLIISEIFSKNLKEIRLETLGSTGMQLPGVNLNTKVWYNPNLESNKFTVPGLVGLIMQNITLALTIFALVREKERGTIEQLIVTPITSMELILGKLIPYIMIGYIGFLVSLALAAFWFNVAVQGSLILLLVLGGLFVICSLAIGMLISTFAKNQGQAMLAMMVVIMPTFLLTGFIFPREAMPGIIYYIGYGIPLTYFLNILRGIILKGVDISFLWKDIAALTLFTLFLITSAILRFKKSLD